MDKKKSVLEQALLQINMIEEATQKNAKGILRSVMKEELNDLMKDEDENPEDEEGVVTDDTVIDEVDNVTPEEDDEETPEVEDEPDFEGGDEDPEMDVPAEDGEEDTDEVTPDLEDEEGDDFGSDDDEVIDATDFPEDEVIKVFKAMKPEDGIIVKKEGNKVEFSDDENQYILKLDEARKLKEGKININSINPDELDKDDKPYTKERPKPTVKKFKPRRAVEEEEETVYEIELGDEPVEDEPEQELPEAARTIGNGVRPPAQKMKFKAGRHDMMNEQIKALKKQNDEYKKALVMFKEKLNEVAVFNANLAYATRLFTEGTTTKAEKVEILKRFDSVSNMKESKNLYEQIKSELGSKKTITESVEQKINNTIKSSKSEVLNEVKAYEDPQTKRIKDLMNKLK